MANSDTLARALAPQLGGVSDSAEKSGRWVVARWVNRRIVMQSRSTFEIVVHVLVHRGLYDAVSTVRVSSLPLTPVPIGTSYAAGKGV